MNNLELLINLLSLQIGLENLRLNQQQVDGIMKELQSTQDSMLNKIYEQNEEIIRLLKGRDKDA